MRPTANELQATLGTAEGLWFDLIRLVEDAASPIVEVWKPSKSDFGWMCVLQHKKRTLLYLTPGQKTITVAIVLGERAFALAMASALPAGVKTKLSEAKPYAEGRGIRVSVTRKDLPAIRELVAAKLAPK